MKKSEYYYNRSYQKHLHELSNPSIKRIEVHGQVATAEEAAENAAKIDLIHFKSTERKIFICCSGIDEHLRTKNDRLDKEADTMGIIPNYKKPEEEPKISLGGNIISFCPFCGSKLILLNYVEKEMSVRERDIITSIIMERIKMVYTHQ